MHDALKNHLRGLNTLAAEHQQVIAQIVAHIDISDEQHQNTRSRLLNCQDQLIEALKQVVTHATQVTQLQSKVNELETELQKNWSYRFKMFFKRSKH